MFICAVLLAGTVALCGTYDPYDNFGNRHGSGSNLDFVAFSPGALVLFQNVVRHYSACAPYVLKQVIDSPGRFSYL